MKKKRQKVVHSNFRINLRLLYRRFQDQIVSKMIWRFQEVYLFKASLEYQWHAKLKNSQSRFLIHIQPIYSLFKWLKSMFRMMMCQQLKLGILRSLYLRLSNSQMIWILNTLTKIGIFPTWSCPCSSSKIK